MIPVRMLFILFTAVMAGAPSLAAAQQSPDLSGTWEMRFREYVRTDAGQLPPMKPEAQARYDERVKKLAAGEQIPDSAVACLPHGTPRIMYTPYPMMIVQRPNLVAFLFEVNHNMRIAYLGQPLPDDPDPTYMGHSIARWEGNTLVVETIGLNNRIQIDRAGLPQGERTRIIERFTLLDAGARLQNKITVSDQTLYTADWSFTVDYKKVDYKLMEYVCDNNRDFKSN